MNGMKVQTFNLESYVLKSYNYLSNMIDRDGLPYFNVFWTEPAEAAHDWPDFGDIMPRQLQAAIMGRYMVREVVQVEKLWLAKILSYIDPITGLFTCPETNFSNSISFIGDQMFTMYALVTAYMDSKDESLKNIAHNMSNSLLVEYNKSRFVTYPVSHPGCLIKSLMVCARYMGCETALKLAELLVKDALEKLPIFTPDNTFRHGGHMHSNLRILMGIADYALYTGKPDMYSRVDAIYRYIKSSATGFGFLPESIGRTGDIISCETCAIMDYIALGTTLANHGHPEYWGDIERAVRNHLVESQLNDTSWVISDNSVEDTDQFTYKNIGGRIKGSYAGWSSPNHILAARETLNKHWGGPELRDKTRLLQNCCGGSGTHAFYIAWKNAARFENGCLLVNMHIDKLLPQAEIRCFQPYKGLLSIKLKENCTVKIRIPGFVNPGEIKVKSSHGEKESKVWGNYLELGCRQADEVIHITYPLPICEEEISIGNPGAKQYKYRVTWKGDTVIRITYTGNDYKTGYSEYDNMDVPIYYGTEGPGLLYQREYMLEELMPEPAAIQLDSGYPDFWYIKKD